MKKIIRKFWGVALVMMMLSSLFVASVPASADAYAFGTDATALPVVSTGLGFIDVAQSGDVIYAIGLNAGVNALYKSADGGATWSALGLGAGLPAGGNWAYVAVAPDDPNIVAVVDKTAVPSTVFVSLTGGAVFAGITALGAGTDVKAIDISSPNLVTGWRSIAVGGSNIPPALGSGGGYLATWQIGNFAAAWTVPTDTLPVTLPVTDDILAVAWSPDYQNDEALLYVGLRIGGVGFNGNVSLHAYSWLYVDYDADIDPSYPRVLASSVAPAVLTCANVDMVLDEIFSLLGYELGFIGAQITTPVATEAGNVWRINTLAPLTAINATALAVNSVAWDGTNLMVAPRGTFATGITIYRSAVAATTAGLTPSSAYKYPGTGTNPLVWFGGGNGYCVSTGNNAAVAKTTDLGRTFVGIALYNTNLNNVIDYWVKSDASVIYALTDDGVDINLWQKSGGVWTRIAILATKTTEPWLVRSANSDTTALYLAKKGAKNMLKSTDGGVNWTPKNCTQNIADYAVQSATVVYVASSTLPTVVKTSGASWATVGALGAGVGYNLTLIADNEFVVGGSTGRVGYYDGAAWATIPVALGTGQVVVTASGLATGDTIYAASATDGGVGSWTIGTNVAAWTVLTADVGGDTFTGVAYTNGVAYAYNNEAGGNDLYRYLGGLIDTVAVANALTFTQVNMVNALQITTGSNTLWARDSAAAPDTIQSFTEYLLAASPTLTYPINNVIIPVNSLNGAVNPFIFQWTAPNVVLPAGMTYTLTVFYNEAGTILVGTQAAIVGTNLIIPVGWLGALNAGDTYYWNVQITAPVKTPATAMGSFTVQQLEAIVPEISSPQNGATIDDQTPGFSWKPIAGVTSYRFELAKEPTFALIVYTEDVPGSGAALPVATQLERGRTYYWRVKALTPAEGEWSQVGNFTVAEEEPTPSPTPPAPTPTIILPTPTITLPQPTVTVIVPTTSAAPVEEIATPYIWAIIIIGAVLVIAVIVLIVRTRRTV